MADEVKYEVPVSRMKEFYVAMLDAYTRLKGTGGVVHLQENLHYLEGTGIELLSAEYE